MDEKSVVNYEEKELRAPSGWLVLFLTVVLYIAAIVLLIVCAAGSDGSSAGEVSVANPVGMVAGIIWLCIGWVPLIGLRVIKPNEALVLSSSLPKDSRSIFAPISASRINAIQ